MTLEQLFLNELKHLTILERERVRKITKHRPYKAKAILSIIKNRKKWKQRNAQNAGKKNP